jgi:hypothetical protein
MKRGIIILGITLAVLATFVCGMIAQKYYGLGNILKKLNNEYVPPDKVQVLKKEHQGKVSIFILAGQSNMEGAGDVQEYTPINTDQRVYVFDENFKWKIGQEPVRSGVGPSISFAKQLIDINSNRVVGIINCARGGTNIGQWSKSYDENSLYLNMIKKALAASSQGKIEGLLFFQGENDTEGDSTDHYDDWDRMFEEFVSNVRADLKNDSLPVIFAQIGKGENRLLKKVKERQAAVTINNVVMIKTDDLNYKENDVPHYTTEGYMEIGRRFGEAWIKNFEHPSR